MCAPLGQGEQGRVQANTVWGLLHSRRRARGEVSVSCILSAVSPLKAVRRGVARSPCGLPAVPPLPVPSTGILGSLPEETGIRGTPSLRHTGMKGWGVGRRPAPPRAPACRVADPRWVCTVLLLKPPPGQGPSGALTRRATCRGAGAKGVEVDLSTLKPGEKELREVAGSQRGQR